jgi:hypothetical protein
MVEVGKVAILGYHLGAAIDINIVVQPDVTGKTVVTEVVKLARKMLQFYV